MSEQEQKHARTFKGHTIDELEERLEKWCRSRTYRLGHGRSEKEQKEFFKELDLEPADHLFGEQLLQVVEQTRNDFVLERFILELKEEFGDAFVEKFLATDKDGEPLDEPHPRFYDESNPKAYTPKGRVDDE